MTGLALACPTGQAHAQTVETVCDNEATDCRTPILALIGKERVGIDVGFWFMSDTRLTAAIIARWRAGVPVRVLMDPRANESKQVNDYSLAQFAAAGIPMRARGGVFILHWKALVLHGQGLVEFGGANYQDGAFSPVVPDVDWIDEMIVTTTEASLYRTLACQFDDLWTNTARFSNYANVAGPLLRRAPPQPHAPEMNFPPEQDFGARTALAIDNETTAADLVMFRFGDARPVDALIRAMRRGVAVRVLAEPDQYRDPAYPWSAYNIDRLWAAGAQIKVRQHRGQTHEKALVLHALGEVVFGSSNWTGASANGQDEHNLFSRGRPALFTAFAAQFAGKWANTNAFTPFVPQPPSEPRLVSTAPGASTVTLTWDTGPFAYASDLYVGRSTSPGLRLANLVGDPVAGRLESTTLTGLLAGVYYWRVVGKTVAGKTTASTTGSFTVR